MIIEFAVENFRTFCNAQKMTFRALADSAHAKTHCMATEIGSVPRLVRTAILIGPNAAGKSNFLIALHTFRELVVNSGRHSEAEFAKLFTPFYGDPAHSQPTVLSIDLLIDRIRYQYRVAYNRQRIVLEQLSVSISRKSQRWYTRRFDVAAGAERWEPFSPSLRGARTAWKNATRPRTLMLSTAARFNAVPLQPLLAWFEQHLEISINGDVPDLLPFARQLQDPLFKARAVNILQSVDIPAIDIRRKDQVPLPGALVQVEFLYQHKGMPAVWLRSNEFSSGANQLARLIVLLIGSSQQDRFLVIDEFDTHLHPTVTRRLLQSLNESTVDRRLQILVVTHTTALLDLNIVRRDEVWLMSRDAEQATHLVRLPEHGPRRHESIARAYMRGRYDSLPRVKQALLEKSLHN